VERPKPLWQQRKLTLQTMCNKMLFLAAACKHIPGIETAFKENGRVFKDGSREYEREIVIAQHHFPVAVYQYLATKKVSTLLTDIQMRTIVQKISQ